MPQPVEDALRHLFATAWHPLATTRDFANPGDFLTFDLLETPILLRNFDGELRAFAAMAGLA